MRRFAFLFVLALLIGGVVLATLGTSDRRVSLDSLLTLWSDTWRDTDQVGMRLTRISDADEMRIGSELARSFNVPGASADESYISEVGKSLLPYLRRGGIRYQFHVYASLEVNAFALPGGHVFVTRGMLDVIESEAELAAVLGHEIAHIDLRHCVERYQYEYRLKKAGVPEIGWMVELAHHIATAGFNSSQELDADARGQALAIQAGYDPDAGAALFERMKAHFHEPSPRNATTPAGEVAQATGNAIGSYFQTHPPYQARVEQLSAMAARNRREWKSKSFYVGKENFKRRTAHAPVKELGASATSRLTR
jgi:predicted Zn-dependent protease